MKSRILILILICVIISFFGCEKKRQIEDPFDPPFSQKDMEQLISSAAGEEWISGTIKAIETDPIAETLFYLESTDLITWKCYCLESIDKWIAEGDFATVKPSKGLKLDAAYEIVVEELTVNGIPVIFVEEASFQ